MRFFDEHSISSIVQWIVLIISMILSCFVIPFALLSDDSQIVDKCSSLKTNLTFSSNHIGWVDDFVNYAQEVVSSMDIVIALPEGSSGKNEKFHKALSDAIGRGVSIRIVTNSRELEVPKGVAVHYFDEPGYTLKMNIAMADNGYIFMPSSFFGATSDPTKPSVAYLAKFGRCESAGQDMEALFDLLWTRKRRVQKHRWIAGRGFTPNHRSVEFLIDPLDLYPLGRSNHSSQVTQALDWTHYQKFVFSSNIFPDNMTSVSDALVGSTISGLFELNQFSEDPLRLIVDEAGYQANIETFRSMLSNIKSGGFAVCGIAFDGTIIVTSKKVILFPSGIADVFKETTAVLGIVFDDVSYISEAKALMTQLDGRRQCRFINPPG